MPEHLLSGKPSSERASVLRLVDGEVSAIQRFFTSVIVDREPITVQSPASALSLATALIDAFLSPRTPRAINFGSISL